VRYASALLGALVLAASHAGAQRVGAIGSAQAAGVEAAGAHDPARPRAMQLAEARVSAEPAAPPPSAVPPAPAVRPAYRELRFEEDWSALRDPEALASRDLFDPLKHVPLTDDGSVWISFGGQLRERVEAWSGFDFGAPEDDDEVFLLSRLLLHADLHLGPHVRVFVEGKSALSTEPFVFGGVRRLDSDTLALQNGFLELRGALPGADATLRLGRQELRFGRQRLVSPLDWANARRTFDGASLALAAGELRVTAFATQPVRVRRYERNDHGTGHAFYGVHAQARPWADGPLRVELYAYGLGRDDVVFEGTAGDEDRFTLGGRASGELPGTGLDFDLEAAWQGGEVGDERIDAAMVATQLGWWWAEAPTSPRAFLGLDYASGDDRPGGDVELFDPLFPLGHAYLGYVDAVGRQNVIAPSLGVTFRPLARTTAELTGYWFWRADRGSGLYDAGGRLLRAGTASRSRNVGAEIDLLVRHQLDPHTVVAVGYSHFFPGGFVERSGPSEAIDFGYLIVQYTF